MLHHLGDLVGANARLNTDLHWLRAHVEGIRRQLELWSDDMKTWNYDELTVATEAVIQGLLEKIKFDPHQQDYYELQAWGAFVLWHRLTNDIRAEHPECDKDFKRLEKPFKKLSAKRMDEAKARRRQVQKERK